jgi:hypothetical protein
VGLAASLILLLSDLCRQAFGLMLSISFFKTDRYLRLMLWISFVLGPDSRKGSHSAAGERLLSCHLHYIMYVSRTNKRLYIATSFSSVFLDVSGQSRRLGALKVATLQRKKMEYLYHT